MYGQQDSFIDIMELPAEEEPEIFVVVEQMPEFPGGEEAMHRFVYTELKYPKAAMREAIEGLTVIRFVVDIDGKVINPEIMRDIGGDCGQEALRIVKAMPTWTPGKQRGRAVQVYYNLPIRFALPEDDYIEVEPMPEMPAPMEEPVPKSKEIQAKPDLMIQEMPPEEMELAPAPAPEEPRIFQVVEKMPEFPGGEKARFQFIADNLEYPLVAIDNGIEGLVVVSFIVDEQGALQDPVVRRDIGAGCGEAALDMIRKMPNWIPGEQRGEKVKVSYNLPVRFKLTQGENK